MSTSQSDFFRQKVFNFKLEPDNTVCADCGKDETEWASVKLGVFICMICAGIHRQLNYRVLSIRLDLWTEELYKAMTGNRKAKEWYEANVPLCWSPPNADSTQAHHEQWIRAKYERKEFIPGAPPPPYLSGLKQGFLMKKMRYSDEHKKRWFLLSVVDLSYYKSYQDRIHRRAIPLTNMNVTLQGPGLDYHRYAMLIVFRDEDDKTRNLYVYAENGKNLIDWYCSIRQAKIKLLRETYPNYPLEDIGKKATRDFIKWGYLLKTPPVQTRFQKRMFVLDGNCLRYYDKPKDAVPLGEIILGANGFHVDENLPEKLEHHANIFMLHAPNRQGGGFPLMAESPESRKSWMKAIQGIIEECGGSPDLCSCTGKFTYENEKDDEKDEEKHEENDDESDSLPSPLSP